jgi:hypothetical protein
VGSTWRCGAVLQQLCDGSRKCSHTQTAAMTMSSQSFDLLAVSPGTMPQDVKASQEAAPARPPPPAAKPASKASTPAKRSSQPSGGASSQGRSPAKPKGSPAAKPKGTPAKAGKDAAAAAAAESRKRKKAAADSDSDVVSSRLQTFDGIQSWQPVHM